MSSKKRGRGRSFASAIAESGKSVAEISSAMTVDELLAAQFERAMSLWSDWLSAASENQREAIPKA